MASSDPSAIFDNVYIVENILSFVPIMDQIISQRVSSVFSAASKAVLRKTRRVCITNRHHWEDDVCQDHLVSDTDAIYWPTEFVPKGEEGVTPEDICFERMKNLMDSMTRVQVMQLSIYGKNTLFSNRVVYMMLQSQHKSLTCFQLRMERPFMSGENMKKHRISTKNMCQMPLLEHIFSKDAPENIISAVKLIKISPNLQVYVGSPYFTPSNQLSFLPKGFKRLQTFGRKFLQDVLASKARETIECIGSLGLDPEVIPGANYSLPSLKHLEASVTTYPVSEMIEMAMTHLLHILDAQRYPLNHLTFRVMRLDAQLISKESWVRLFNSVQKLTLETKTIYPLIGPNLTGHEAVSRIVFSDSSKDYEGLDVYLHKAFRGNLKCFVIKNKYGRKTTMLKSMIEKLEGICSSQNLTMTIIPQTEKEDRKKARQFMMMKIKKQNTD